ncbi:TM0106 family RecB-like putative nuclease [Demequina sp.]|uniref:TM0106 family RecB-like putative nuclease n=1 Tax=Demequina sp. TaxID=2050685 RepID=UPI003A85D1CD
MQLHSDSAGHTTVTWSASDLAVASDCEFGFLRRLDVKAGRIPDPRFERDAMLERAAALGDVHERRILDAYRAQFGDGVVEIPRPAHTPQGIADAVAATAAAFQSGAQVVFQAAFSAPDPERTTSFIGYADFITRQPDGSYRVEDTKLARRAKVTALLQMAAYAEQLERTGVPVDTTITLILGDGRRSDHHLDDVAPVFRLRRERLLALIMQRQDEGTASHQPVEWGDDRYAICGRCDWCALEIDNNNDVLQVAGLSVAQRVKLRAHAIDTTAQLATSTDPIPGIGATTLENLRTQASLQATRREGEPPPVQVTDASALSALPPPSEGDMFFDFEGDPLHEERGTWGLDYLWGWCDAAERFTPIWAHSLEQEAVALRAFLDTVSERRERHPNMHVYHYAAYEKTHLLAAAVRHGFGADEVDDLLRQHVLVDLYPIVRRAMRVGSASYSIKKLEPLYFDRTREGVDNAGDSVDAYAQACALRDAGDVAGWEARLGDIARYNDDDVASTVQLRDWLLGFQRSAGVAYAAPAQAAAPSDKAVAARQTADAVAAGLLKAADAAAGRGDEDSALVARMARAAAVFHPNEDKVFWQSHYSRLVQPVDDWADERDVFVVERCEVLSEWERPPRARTLKRRVRLHGRAAPGSRWAEGDSPFAVYAQPAPFAVANAEPGARAAHNRTAVLDSGPDWIELLESLPGDAAPYSEAPVALTPSTPPATGALVEQIQAWAQRVTAVPAAAVADPCVDLLLRRPPRVVGAGALGEEGLSAADPEDATPAIVDSLLRLKQSYVAVQGPPGTGKTHVGSHAIAALVRDHGWRVGVVGQSHRVVENFLDAVVGKAGLDASLVGKSRKGGDTELAARAQFTVLPSGGAASFVTGTSGGCVVGGTAWTFAGLVDKLDRPLDLLVIDEAGQFALPSTIAAAQAAMRLLLLGDPQQLPQVTQARHQEDVDASALGWQSAGHDVLPPELGYFLALTRRMHPALTEPVSRLSYERSLRAHAVASTRSLEGVSPGLMPVPVMHAGNTVESVEEAATVVAIARDVLGRAWTDPGAGRDSTPLTEADVIVITPYNGQVNAVQSALAAAGLAGVRVGTVDKFQGQEAPVCIVTLAASSAREIPRGTEFLLNRNRLNVAISRGQWVGYLVHSPGLLDSMPHTPDRLSEVARFAGLTDARKRNDGPSREGAPTADGVKSRGVV